MAQNTRPTLLVSKPADEITWQDVIQFCELQKPESAILDYKREFPERLENVLVAMANTYGGTVIVGVTEDPKTTKPLAPFSGIEFKRGLQDRVQQVVSSHIRPLLSTQVAVAVNEEETRAFVVIRIDQSPLVCRPADS